MQQLTCNIDLACYFYFLFFSFVLIELNPFVLKEKVVGEKFWKSVKKCEKSEMILPFSCCPLVFLWNFPFSEQLSCRSEPLPLAYSKDPAVIKILHHSRFTMRSEFTILSEGGPKRSRWWNFGFLNPPPTRVKNPVDFWWQLFFLFFQENLGVRL